MPGVIQTTVDFSDGDQVLSSDLDEITGGSSFTDAAIIGTTLTVNAGKLQVGTVTAAELGTSSVTTEKIADVAVTLAKMATGSVGATQIVGGSVTVTELADAAVTFPKIAAAAFSVRANVQTPVAGTIVTPDVLKYHPGVTKAYGIVDWAPGVATVAGGYNVASAAATSNTMRTVTLSTPMADLNYTVLVTYQDDTPPAAAASAVPVSVNTFIIYGIAQASRKAYFSVLGNLAP